MPIMKHGQKDVLSNRKVRVDERDCRLAIESDEEIDSGFPCLLDDRETDKGTSITDEVKVETARILRKARKQKWRSSKTIVIIEGQCFFHSSPKLGVGNKAQFLAERRQASWKSRSSSANNHHKVTEIHNFSQDDLMTEDIFVLDCHPAIFVWLGQQVDSKMKMHALTIGELSVIAEERDKYQTLVNELKKPEKDETGSKVANELQLSLAKKECCIKEMESSLNEQKEAYNRQREEIKLLNERLNNEARRIKSLERESDRLRSEISLLESKLGHGDFSAASTKVLRMVNTLAVDNEAKQTIQALQTELQKTKDRLQAVEELNNQSGNAAKSVDCQISEKITQLKEQIATLEKREERYKTVFADRISVFRRACCELFGYKIVMDEHQRPNGIPVTRFTLLSIYAQNDEEKLEFEYDSGNVTILGNDYSSHPEISRQIGIFIHKMNSIPAFTANITVESFNRRTLS